MGSHVKLHITFCHSRQEVSKLGTGQPRQRLPGDRGQDAARDPPADAADRPQHHHVRGLPQPVVHVTAPPRAHTAQ